MLDEFDDDFGVEALHLGGANRHAEGAARPRAARLVSRLYGAASAPLRTRILACLVRPLGPLGLAAVASGAFARLLYRGGEARAGLDDLAAYSTDQVFELARFAEQVNPDALQQVAGLLADNPIGASAFGATVAMLLVRAVRGLAPNSPGPTAQPATRPDPSVAVDAARSGHKKGGFGHGSETALDELVRRRREQPAPPATDVSQDRGKQQ